MPARQRWCYYYRREVDVVAGFVAAQPVDQLAKAQQPAVVVLGEFIGRIAFALDLRLDNGVAAARGKMIKRPMGQRGPMVDQPGQLGGPPRIIVDAVEICGRYWIDPIERKAALRLQLQPPLVGQQPLLLGQPRCLTAQRGGEGVLSSRAIS